MGAIYSFDSLCKLDKITAPTLIIFAEGLKQEQQQASNMHKMIKNSKKELVLDTYHATNLEKPEEFNQLILNFLLAPSLTRILSNFDIANSEYFPDSLVIYISNQLNNTFL